MVHHYEEEKNTEEHVRFNCSIEQPFTQPVDEPPPEPPPPTPKVKKEKATCCPISPPAAHSDLVDALPTVLVAIGFAYAIGMLSGAFIFSSPVE